MPRDRSAAHSRRVATAASAAAAALVLSSCGGGLYINVGPGFDEVPPVVTMSTPVTSVPAGQPVTLVAQAYDEGGIDDVTFFRVDGGIFTALGSDGSPPYEWTTSTPTDGRSALVVFARARDQSGNTTDSPTVSITITAP